MRERDLVTGKDEPSSTGPAGGGQQPLEADPTLFDIVPPAAVIKARLEMISKTIRRRDGRPSERATASPAEPSPYARQSLPVQHGIPITPLGSRIRRSLRASAPIARFRALPINTRYRILGLTGAALALLIAVGSFAAFRPPRPTVVALPDAPRADRRSDSMLTEQNAAIAKEARELLSAGRDDAAIEKLEAAAGSTEGYGDAALHSALAYAYARAGRGSEAAQHYWISSKSDPSAIRQEDLPVLVRLLSLPKRDADRVVAVLRAIGPRAAPELRRALEDHAGATATRRRAEEALAAVDGYSAS